MYVVATAGHVDHGKSTLVSALTGADPDRLDEEKRRGLSIALGYCWTHVEGLGEVAFVDVPGHERFVSTTLSGLGPVPTVMFVVAADDPWMPQAAEHLAALDALEVRRGVLVVTRADLTDPAPALARARAQLSRTSLAAVPSCTVSGRTGEGVPELRRVLRDVLGESPQPDPDEDVRLWVDRAFHVRGAGTVVTGTLSAGTIRVEDRLALGDRLTRVRGIECLGGPVDSAHGVARVALALGGKPAAGLQHDSVLVTPDAFEHVGVADVHLRGEGRPPARPILHIGAASVAVHVRPLGVETARLTFDRVLPLRIGDRAILRDPGDRSIWGVRVLHPGPPPLRRRGAAAVRDHELSSVDGTLGHEVLARGAVLRSRLRRLGVVDTGMPAGTVEAGDWLLAADWVAGMRGRLVQVVRHGSRPLAPGVPIGHAARSLGLPDPALVKVLVEDPVVLREGMLTIGDRVLPPGLDAMLSALRAELAASPFAAPDATLLAELGLDRPSIAVLHRAGHVLRVSEGVVLLPEAPEQAVARLGLLEQPFTTSQARQALETSRRVALPLLAHLDRTGHTVRLPDDRRRIRERD